MKYNWSIIGHENAIEILEKDIESGNLAHAYLLSGPNSIGKYTVAKKMAGILQCKNDFCHECTTCVQVRNGSHIDTIEMRGNEESIKIDEIRALGERVAMTRQSNYKVVLMQSVERMTNEAANSFLKTLEEPPVRTIFIMTTNNLRLLLPTVTSRVRLVKFSSVSPAYLKKKLEDLYPDVDEETMEKVSLLSLGKTGKAVQLIESPEKLAERIEIYHAVQNFLELNSVVDRFAFVEEIVADNQKLALFIEILTHVLRSKMLGDPKASDEYVKSLSKIFETAKLLKKNVNARMALENLMLSI